MNTNIFSKKLHGIPTAYTFDDVLLRPLYSSVNREDISLQSFITKGNRLELPFISSPMDTITNARMAITMAKLGGFSIIHRNMTLEEQIVQVKEVIGAGCKVSAALGPQDTEWAEKLHEATGLDLIFIDNAHAHTRAIIEAIPKMKKIFSRVIVGNIATRQAAHDLIAAGADALKVGIGSGSICTTRTTTGIGVPQLSAVAEVADEASQHEIPVIADGGIRTGADIAKVLAVGASSVVLGNVLAGTSDTPGEILTIKGKQYKNYRGMGSRAAMEIGSRSRYNQSYLNVDELVPEGVEGLMLYKGKTEEVVLRFGSYLKSSLFYCGAASIQDLHKLAEFVVMTNAGLIESHPHDILQK